MDSIFMKTTHLYLCVTIMIYYIFLIFSNYKLYHLSLNETHRGAKLIKLVNKLVKKHVWFFFQNLLRFN